MIGLLHPDRDIGGGAPTAGGYPWAGTRGGSAAPHHPDAAIVPPVYRTAQPVAGAYRADHPDIVQWDEQIREWRQDRRERRAAARATRVEAQLNMGRMHDAAPYRRKAVAKVAATTEFPAISVERPKEKGLQGLRVRRRGKIDDEIVARHDRAISAFLAARSEAAGLEDGEELTLDDLTDMESYALGAQRQQMLGYRNNGQPLELSPRGMRILQGIERAYRNEAYEEARLQHCHRFGRRRAMRKIKKSYQAKLAQTMGGTSDADTISSRRQEFFVERKPAASQERPKGGTPSKGRTVDRASAGGGWPGSARASESARPARPRTAAAVGSRLSGGRDAQSGRADSVPVRPRPSVATGRPAPPRPPESHTDESVRERRRTFASIVANIRETLNPSDGMPLSPNTADTLLALNVQDALDILGTFPEEGQAEVLQRLELDGVLRYAPGARGGGVLGRSRYTYDPPERDPSEVIREVAIILSGIPRN